MLRSLIRPAVRAIVVVVLVSGTGPAAHIHGRAQKMAVTSAAPAVAQSFHRLNPALTHFETCLRRPIDDDRLLLVVRGSGREESGCGPRGWYSGPDILFGVFLADRADPDRVRELAMLAIDDYDEVLRFERADSSSFVLWRGGATYGGTNGRIKLFFDAKGMRLLRRVDYKAEHGETRVTQADDRLCATMRTGRNAGVLTCLREGALAIESEIPLGHASMPPPPPDDLPALPQSTYDEFARARPDRVADGYRRDATNIEETVGPWQRAGSRIWFGKTFYDGEGTTGVGALGFYDARSRQFSFLQPPEILPSSVSALLVEGDVAWAGLVTHPEGASKSNGLLRVNLNDGTARRFDVPDVILTITRWRSALYLGTMNGLCVLENDGLRCYRLEPALQGGLGIVVETRIEP